MRKIGSDRDSEQKRKRRTLIFSILLLVILIGGTAGYAFISSTENQSETNPVNSSAARFTGNRWAVSVDGHDFSFANSPDSLKEISVETTVSLMTYGGSPLYIVSDSDAITSELASVLSQYSSRVQRACYGKCNEDLPEKDCSENLIVWRDGLNNQVYQEEGCVFIEGDLRAVDAFLYKLLKIAPQ